MSNLFETTYNPDVLSCIANLSNDEVFTPPELVNEMLDMLPEELWSDSSATFLDPACKSGVFLREIAKRLIKGLEEEIPNLEERLEHIYKKQLFGIAITELTSLLSRRSLYCSKWPNSEYSVVKFDDVKGNIDYVRLEHTWVNGRCKFCGAAQSEYDRDESLEQYAYEFIHLDNPEEVLPVKFDVIIGNPPYQLSDGGAQASAMPIYNLFVENALKLNPRYLVMIIPSRWMTGGRGLNRFREEMIHDTHFKVLHDFAECSDCFPSVEIKGGVCYFLWGREHDGLCDTYFHKAGEAVYMQRYLVEEGDDIYIRDSRLIPLKEKVEIFGEASLETLVSSQKPYGLRGDVFKNTKKYGLPPMLEIKNASSYRVLGLDEKQKRAWRYVDKDYPLPSKGLLDSWKVFIPRNYGSGEFGEAPAPPVLASPGDLCTETFIEIGPFDNKNERDNFYSYLKTKFFRAMVGIRKHDQSAARGVYRYVPMQDFSKPWTDEELYAKYGLTEEEVAFIESMIRPMDLGGDSDD